MMGGLVFVFIVFGIGLYAQYPDTVKLIFVVTFAILITYAIYHSVLNSKWLHNYLEKQKSDELVRLQEEEIERKLVAAQELQEKHDAEWVAYTPPHSAQFLLETKVPDYPVVHDALSTIAAVCIKDKARLQNYFTVKQYQELYQSIVATTKTALLYYSTSLPSMCRKLITDSPFTITMTPTEEDMETANRALAEHFRGHTDRIMGPIRPFNPLSLPHEPSKPVQHSWDEDGKYHKKQMSEYKEELRQYEMERKEYQKSEEELFETQTLTQQIFWGTPLYHSAESFLPEPFEVHFRIPYKERFAGTWIIAPSGQGKTNLMWHLIDADRKRRGTVVIMDSKGTLLNAYRGYEDAVLIDAKTARINPFQIGQGDQAIDFIEYIFSLIAVGMSPKQLSLFYPVLRLVTKIPSGSLDTFKKILLLGWRELNLGPYIQHCDPNTRDFFTVGNPPSFDNKKYSETKNELIWRFDLFLSKPAMQTIFSTTDSNIDFFDLLDSGKTILINNNKNDLGENGAEFFGRFFLALTWMKALTRTELPDDQKIPVFFYIDEAQTVIANDAKVPTILDECRSQMIALTIAHQRLNRIHSAEVLDALFNCPVRLASVDNDAAAIAHRFNLAAEDMRLSAHKFACFVRYEQAERKMEQAVILNIPFFDMKQFPPYAPVAEPKPTIDLPGSPKKKQKP